MPKVIIYSTARCPFCIRTRQLLEQKGVDYQEKRIDLDANLKKQMIDISGRCSVPQIFIDNFHVGGFDDMCILDLAGELDTRLKLI